MIGLYRGKSFISKLIRWRTWSKYSHASWILDSGEVIEAWWGGVRLKPCIDSDHTDRTQIDLFRINLTRRQREGVEEFLMAQVGKKYDFRSIAKFVSRRAEVAADQDKWFCSELVFAALASVNRAPLARVPAFKVSPGLLAVSPMLIAAGQMVTGADGKKEPKS